MNQQSAKKSPPPPSNLPTIRIVVADDHPVVRFGVKNMLQNEPGFEVIGEAEDGDDAITQTLELEPDILLLDVAMPRLPGLEAMRAIMTKSPRVKIVLLTSTISTQQVIEALQIGARGIVLKDSVVGDLAQALRAVLGGDYWIGGERVANLLKALQGLQAQAAAVPERKTYGLTPRELEVVTCIVEGCSNRDIAKQFSISEETVKRHLSNVHFQVKRGGLQHPDAAEAPLRGHHLVNEIHFHAVVRLEGFDVGLMELVELRVGLVGEDNHVRREPVFERVLRGLLNSGRRLRPGCFCAILARLFPCLSRRHWWYLWVENSLGRWLAVLRLPVSC